VKELRNMALHPRRLATPDGIAFQAPSFEAAALAVLLAGGGRFGATCADTGDTVPVFPNGGGDAWLMETCGHTWTGLLRKVDRVALAEPNVLHFDIEIDAPYVLTKPWKTTRIWYRQRARKFDIVEGVCLEGNFSERADADGNHAFVPVERHPWGNIQAPKK
jgi:hypothetical protein